MVIIDSFSHNLDLIEQARKNFQPQNTDDKTVLAEQSDYVWDLNGLMNHLLVPQQIYQVTQLTQSLFTKIMLEYIHLLLTQHL